MDLRANEPAGSDGPHQGKSGQPIGASTWLLGIIAVLAVAWTLRAAMMVTLPVAAALLIALAVAPVSDWVQARVSKNLRWLGYVAAMLIVVAVLALFVTGVALAGQQVAGEIRDYLPQFQQQLQRNAAGLLPGDGESLARMLQKAGSYAASVFNMAWETVAGLVLVFFLILLMLIEAPEWRAKLVTAAGGNAGKWEEAAVAIGQRFRRFFLTRLVLGAITGLLYVGWLALFGIDFLLVWGLLALLLNFIPTVGSLIAGILPVIFAFVQKDPASAAMVAAGLLVIEQVMGNFVDPRLMGRQLSISPLVVLVSLLLWTWIWGPAGALLAAPITVLITIILAHIAPLKRIALYLSNEKDMVGLEARTSPSEER